MQTLFFILVIGLYGAGVAVLLIGSVRFLIAAFQEHVLWGLGSLLIPIVSLVFLIMHWDKARPSFLVQLVGLAILLVGAGAAALGTSLGY